MNGLVMIQHVLIANRGISTLPAATAWTLAAPALYAWETGRRELFGGRGIMRDPSIALYIAVTTVVIAVLFVVYALSGADLCVWCSARGK